MIYLETLHPKTMYSSTFPKSIVISTHLSYIKLHLPENWVDSFWKRVFWSTNIFYSHRNDCSGRFFGEMGIRWTHGKNPQRNGSVKNDWTQVCSFVNALASTINFEYITNKLDVLKARKENVQLQYKIYTYTIQCGEIEKNFLFFSLNNIVINIVLKYI